ncbi:S-adenosyl-L-methionine-dependent methyltransferase [Pseudovirgaria hyperparasitica]|uniref:S-adenosyl-L-methionine-dependent methyltransferase n=1 Tax=Pseudovirgaria hyperparasitica TaxID=470096 RepID=A0A6A6W3M8_9PEZI|nr:S-adenosyl-L-methionine-dependent methyltransferase [Pseudovirgaria hyperparasitica]KAF2757213.1 S-adenosyl-L-methionine-dependent methyltransferase [Pseudovirgaria hyperparasitica]
MDQFDIEAGLESYAASFDHTARNAGLNDYTKFLSTKLDRLVMAYILEAFRDLGVDLRFFGSGERVPNFVVLPRFLKIRTRLWDIVESNGLIRRSTAGVMVRTASSAHARPSSELHEKLLREYPNYAAELRLLQLTGPKLAKCMRGLEDPEELLFGSEEAQNIVEAFEYSSPLASTMKDQLVTFVASTLQSYDSQSTATLEILEIGAETGHCTDRMLDTLARSGVKYHYTFSDPSSKMLAKAQAKYQHTNSNMFFEHLHLDHAIPSDLQHKYDIIIGTNLSHAMTDRTRTLQQMRSMLSPHGFTLCSEITTSIEWYDLVFGLLDSWWCGAGYALQPTQFWMEAFRNAGYYAATFSRGQSQDANIERLLIGTNFPLSASLVQGSRCPSPRGGLPRVDSYMDGLDKNAQSSMVDLYRVAARA